MYRFILCFALLVLCSATPATTEPIHLTAGLIIALIAGIWEVVGRLIPSIGQITIIGKIIEVLNWVSEFLNKKK
jgi:hypothetical protein